VIVARDLTVVAGAATLLDRVTLTIALGEVVALVGPNGAGKSTLLAALAGDRRPTAGTVHIAGVDAAVLRPHELADRRAVLPQRAALNAPFTALEVVQLGDLGAGGELAARRALDAVGLARFADRAYPTLSGGEQQRVQLARVLVQLGERGGRALFLDEPTAALDPRHQLVVLGLARRAAARGDAVVIALHDLGLAARWADRVALLAHGQLVACGPPAEVLRREPLRAVFDVDFDAQLRPLPPTSEEHDDAAILVLPPN